MTIIMHRPDASRRSRAPLPPGWHWYKGRPIPPRPPEWGEGALPGDRPCAKHLPAWIERHGVEALATVPLDPATFVTR